MQTWLEKVRWLLFLAVVAVTLGLVIALQRCRPEPQPVILSTSTPSAPLAPTPTPHPLRVYVSGAVQRPDVYTLVPDSIVKDALTAAGGPTGDADLDRINLALTLSDGQHVYVPHLGEENPPVPLRLSQPETAAQVNINTADLAALESLPGIGPAIAQRILDYRQVHGPFAQVEDITNVPGIGPAILGQIQELITTN